MSDITLKVGEVVLRSSPLTRSILKQVPIADYDTLLKYSNDGSLDGRVLGWVHETVLGDCYWLIVKVCEGRYVRHNVMPDMRAKYE